MMIFAMLTHYYVETMVPLYNWREGEAKKGIFSPTLNADDSSADVIIM